MTRALKFAVLSLVLFVASYAGLRHVYAMGAESTIAQFAQVAPTPEEGGFLSLIMQGQYIAAVGGFLTLLVAALRNEKYGLAKLFPWFATKAGGYILGFGSAFTLYVSAAMQAGGRDALTIGVFGAALAAGWAAAGGWESLLDLINLFKTKPQDPAVVSTPEPGQPSGGGTTLLRRVSLAVILAMVVTACSSGCGPKSQIAKEIIIDCTAQNQDSIIVLAASLWNTVMSGGSWDQAEAQAKNAGVAIGGCALAEAVQRFLGGTRSLTPEQSWGARNALERFRATVAGGATFRTHAGDI